jgi:hypothetical protein
MRPDRAMPENLPIQHDVLIDHPICAERTRNAFTSGISKSQR